MILQALNQYYQRKRSADKTSLPSFGFERKSIPIILELNKKADLVQIRVTDAKVNPRACEYIVPQGAKRSSGIVANLFWDNVEYALGMNTEDEQQHKKNKNREKVVEKHKDFVKRISQLKEPAISDQGVQVLLNFLQKFDPNSIRVGPHSRHYKKLMEKPNVSFRLQGDNHLICERPNVRKALSSILKVDETTDICLITGEPCVSELTHPAIKGVLKAQSSGANIVSFNQDAFNSYGKKQGSNAPISQEVAFSYTTALNHLLKKGSEQRIQVGDASTVFWSEIPDPLENDFQSIWGATSKSIKDDPDKFTKAVRSVLSSVKRGAFSPSQKKDRFYVLGLSPNASRISIRFWVVGTVEETYLRIDQYFEELNIEHADSESGFLPLSRLLVNIAVQGKAENIPPNLAGDVMHSILTGKPYPHTLLAATVRRCKAEQSVNYPRAALIKAYLCRLQPTEKIKKSLDKDNVNIAYRLGRLFAVLEKIQKEASPGINATIRNHYYGAASTNPVSVFTTLLKLKNHHLTKLGNPGRKTNFEKILGEILSAMTMDFPNNLSLQDQGRFAVGYYHQRQDFFTKNTSNNRGLEQSTEEIK